MKITRRHLEKLIIESLSEAYRDPTARHRSEISYRKTHWGGAHRDRSVKQLQKAFHKASRVGARGEIESQLASMGPMDIDTIGDIVPIGKDRWSELSGVPGPEGVSSEKDNYLINLAWDVAEGKVQMSDEDISRLIDLSPAFDIQLGYAFDEIRVQDDIEDASMGRQNTDSPQSIRGGETMKITENSLRRIIQEELSRILLEVTLPNKTVRYDRGTNVRDSVKQIQAALTKLKAWDGGTTGKFDKDLRRALRKWQGSVGLGADGVYGKNTKAKMEEELGKLKGEDPKPEEGKGEGKPGEKPDKPKASEEGLRTVVAGGKDPKRIAYLKQGREWEKGKMTFKRLGGVKKILSDLNIQAVQQGKRAWQDGDDVAQVALWLKKWDQPKPFRDAMKAGKVNPEDVTQIVIKVGRKGIFKVAQDIDTKQPE